MNKVEKWEKLLQLEKAIKDIEGIDVLFNILKNSIVPLRVWLHDVLKTGERR